MRFGSISWWITACLLIPCALYGQTLDPAQAPKYLDGQDTSLFNFHKNPLPDSEKDLLLQNGFQFVEDDGSVRSADNTPLNISELYQLLQLLKSEKSHEFNSPDVSRRPLPEPSLREPAAASPDKTLSHTIRTIPSLDANRLFDGERERAQTLVGLAGTPSAELEQRMEAIIQAPETPDSFKKALNLVAQYADPRDLDDYVKTAEHLHPKIVPDPTLLLIGAQAQSPYLDQKNYLIKIRSEWILAPSHNKSKPGMIVLKDSQDYYRELIGHDLNLQAMASGASPSGTTTDEGHVRRTFSDGSARESFTDPTLALVLLHEMEHHRRHDLGGGANIQSDEWASHSAEYRMLARMLGSKDVPARSMIEGYLRWSMDPVKYRDYIYTLGENVDMASQERRLRTQLKMPDSELIKSRRDFVLWSYKTYHGISEKEKDLNILLKNGYIDSSTYRKAKKKLDQELQTHKQAIQESLKPENLRKGARMELEQLAFDKALDPETDRRNESYLNQKN